MDALSNSLEQDSSGRPSDTQNPSFVPRKMTVMQGALGRFAQLREGQQCPRSIEEYRAPEHALAHAEIEERKDIYASTGAPMTVQCQCFHEDQSDLTAQAQKDTSCTCTQDPNSLFLTPARHLTRFETEYEARKLAAASDGTASFIFPSAPQPRVSTEDYKTQEVLDAQPPFKARTPFHTFQLAYVQAKIKKIELSRAKYQVAKWNSVHPSTVEMHFHQQMESFVTKHGIDLQDVVFTPMRIHKTKADAQAHYEALLAKYEEANKTVGAAPALVQVDHQAEPSKQAETPTQALSEDQAQTQSSSEKTKNPATAQTPTALQMAFVEAYEARKQAEKQAEAREKSVLSNLQMAVPTSTQSEDNHTDQTQKDTSSSNDTHNGQTAPEAQAPYLPCSQSKKRALGFVNAVVTIMEVHQAKRQAVKWAKLNPRDWALAKTQFENRMKDFAKKHGVDPQAVGIKSVDFAKSQADAQAQFEALLAGAKVTAKLHAAILTQPQVSTFKQIFALFLTHPNYESAVQIVNDVLSLMERKAPSHLVPQEQTQSNTMEKTENPGPAQTQSLNQDSTADQAPKDTPPAEIEEAPLPQPPTQDQTPHPKLSYVQSIVKVNEVALAKHQLDYYNRCNPEYWADVEMQFVESMKAFVERHGVDPRDVVISSVGLAKSREEARKQFDILFTLALDRDHYKVSKRTMAELESLKECGDFPPQAPAQAPMTTQEKTKKLQDLSISYSMANEEIESLKRELAETNASYDEAAKEFDAKSEKTRLEHLKQVDYFQRKMITGQVENELLKSKLCKEESTSELLRASLEESKQEVERLKKELEAKSKPEVKKALPCKILLPLAQAEKDVQAQLGKKETTKLKVLKMSELEISIQNKIQAVFKAKAEEKVVAEAEEKAKIEANAEIYAKAYVKAKAEAKAKARAEVETQNSLEAVAQAQIRIQKLQSFIDSFIDHYHKSSEKYQEQIRCHEYDIQKLTEETDYQIEDLKKEVEEKDAKILELQKELWKVIDQRQEARRDVQRLSLQMCNHW